jgi:hypothetical protein
MNAAEIFTANGMRASLLDLGLVGTLENEIAYFERRELGQNEGEIAAVLLQASLDAINKSGVALQTVYRILPQFRSPQTPAEKEMAALVLGAIRTHMPGFLDPHNPPTAH